jgi:transglutaminase-like putative cysteine protease
VSRSHKEKPPRVRQPTTWHDWVSLVLLSGTLGIAIYSIEQSKWIDPQPALMTVFGLGILAGLILSRVPALAAHPLALAGGVAVTLWQMRPILPWADTLPALLRVLINIRPSQSTLPFAVFLALFTWAMAYTAAWYLMRKRNAWVGVLLGAAAMLVNLSNLADEHYRFFAIYMAAAALLIGQVTLAKHYSGLKKWGARYGARNALGFLVSVIILSVVLTSVTWALPEVKAKHLQTVFNTKALAQAVDTNQINIFASVPAKWSVLRNEHQNDLAFTPPNLSKEVQFTITSDKPLAFWRLRRYDIYSASGWTSSRTDEAVLKGGAAVAAEALPPSRTEVTYKVTSKIKTDVLLSAGEFVSSDIQVAVHNLESQNDIMAITSEHMLTPSDSYFVRTVINAANPAELAQANSAYPEHIKDHYLQLPSDLPRRVRSITQVLARNARNPYDKAVAVVKYLSRFGYVRDGTTAPIGADAVDYFLTTSQSGNCNNFASAMVVMLRSIGIPARLSTGYLLRERDEDGALALRAIDYHARPEVYFPGYGWVEFEATPITETVNEHEERAVAGIIDSNVGPSIAEMDASAADEPDTLASASNTPSPGEKKSPAPGFEDWIDDANALAPVPRSWTETLLRPIAIGLLALAFLALLYRQLRRFRDASEPARVYSRMCSLSRFARLRPSPQQTPLEYCARLSAVFPAQSQAFTDLTWAYLKSEFGQKNLGEEGRESLRQSWRTVYRAMLGRLLHGA